MRSTEATGEGVRDGRRAAKCTVTTKFGVVLPTPGVIPRRRRGGGEREKRREIDRRTERGRKETERFSRPEKTK